MRRQSLFLCAATVLALAGFAVAQSSPRRWPIARISQRRALLEILQRSDALEKQRQALASEYDAVVAEIVSDLAIPRGIRLRASEDFSELVEIAPVGS